MSTLIRLENLSKHFFGVHAVKDVSCELKKGEIVGLVGKNGAGKSTLIRMLAGVAPADAGQILVDGAPVAITSTKQAETLGLAFVHQELNDIPRLSIAENILLGQGYPKAFGLIDTFALRRRASEALSLVNSELDPDRKVHTLSIAERRVVMIAAALARKARVLVLDEPSASLTDSEISALHAILQKLRRQGLSVVYVSHRLGEILSLTDRTMVMRDGQLVDTRPTASLDHAGLVSLITGKTTSIGEPIPLVSAAIDGTDVLSLRNAQLGKDKARFDLDVASGEILGIAGLVGSGRSEVLRLIMGADQIAGASVWLNGVQLNITSPQQAWAAGIGLLPEDRQELGVFGAFGVGGNITISTLAQHRLARGTPFPKLARENASARSLVARLKIKAPNIGSPMRTLSGGNQQKAILARCLAANVKWLLLDEPTHGVDIESKIEIMALVRELAAAGVGVIYVCSDFEELIQIATRVAVMRERELVASFNHAPFDETELLRQCYSIDASVHQANLESA